MSTNDIYSYKSARNFKSDFLISDNESEIDTDLCLGRSALRQRELNPEHKFYLRQNIDHVKLEGKMDQRKREITKTITNHERIRAEISIYTRNPEAEIKNPAKLEARVIQDNSHQNKNLQDLLADYVFKQNERYDVVVYFNLEGLEDVTFNQAEALKAIELAVNDINGLRVCLCLKLKSDIFVSTDLMSRRIDFKQKNVENERQDIIDLLLELNWRKDSQRLFHYVRQNIDQDGKDQELGKDDIESLFFQNGIDASYDYFDDRKKCVHQHLKTRNMRRLIEAHKKLSKFRELFCLKREFIQTLDDLEGFRSHRTQIQESRLDYIKSRLEKGIRIELLDKNHRFFKPTNKVMKARNQTSVFEFECKQLNPGRFGANITTTAGPFWVDFVQAQVAYTILKINDLTRNYVASFNKLQNIIRFGVTSHQSHKLDDRYYACISETNIPVEHAILKMSDPEQEDILGSFSHFCLEHSNQNVVVVVMKSHMKSTGELTLLETVIHSNGRNYGSSDLGRRGIDDFVYAHKCNEVCQAWQRNLAAHFGLH